MNKKNRYGALVTLYPFLESEKEYDTKNMGDYMQTIAGMQYFPHIDEYVERDLISDFCLHENSSIPVKVIMNAWWMWNYKKWPPTEIIDPFPISMHISPLHFEEMLSGEGLRWFKRNEPIGCRDNATVQRLQSKGIECYYSGCLTLTLGQTYKPVPKCSKKGLCFADPYIIVPKTKIQQIKAFAHAILAPFTIYTLCKKSYFSRSGYNNSFPFRKHKFLKSIMIASAFHRQYSSFFSNSILRKSEFISHVKIIQKRVDTNTSLINDADIMLRHYQTLKLVVTSRIHAALPCLAMETPVIFIDNSNVESESWNANRLDGLTNLCRCMQLSEKGLTTNDEVLMNIHKISYDIPVFENKEDWKPIAQNLIKKCVEFVNAE